MHNNKFKEWFQRYAKAELLGTVLALLFASYSYSTTHSYVLSAGAGFVGEGIGFFGFFIVSELIQHSVRYQNLPWYKKIPIIIGKSSTNLIVEFAPAEILDNIFIRPLAMFYVPQHIKPYGLGFLIGKLSADVVFYVIAIVGYEARKKFNGGKAHKDIDA